MSPRISAPALRSSPVEGLFPSRRSGRAQPAAAPLRCMAAIPVSGRPRYCIVFGSHITTQGKAISSPSRTTSVATKGNTPR